MHNSPAACTYFILQRNKQGELAVSDIAKRAQQIKLLEEAIQAIASIQPWTRVPRTEAFSP